ncbi:hypothetical protein [Flagellimonas nanhaiensis]|uniref:DUF3575 domain-containing protein n=1 Tax=Flagellimonas nanhaiensis TaxID=2292706 RepID=A0A371JSN1_9FLAO|nr:hypothetical protein [Allomuricauda nanhaiensis]RDY60811.1 hypothetical protein DX873_01115 [Allomuricauda nanhaiensis]
MKVSTFFLFFLLVANWSFSQSNGKVEDHQLTLNFLLPGVVYEHGISNNSTITAEATIGLAYRDSDFFDSGFGIYPIGKVQYRHYYNFQRRLEKGKNISRNTGNYIAPMLAVQGGKAVVGDLDYASDYFGGIGAVYGLQRTGRKGLSFRFEVGPAYFFDELDNDFGLFMALKLGWVVNKKK